MAHPGLFLLPLFTALVLLINGIVLCSVEVIRIGGSIDPSIIPKKLHVVCYHSKNIGTVNVFKVRTKGLRQRAHVLQSECTEFRSIL